MNLTIEQMREIVDGAPEWAESFNVYLVAYGSGGIPCKGDVLISSLRTALADHNSKPCQHGYDIACLICGFGTEDGVRVWRKQIEADNVTDIKNHISPNTKVIDHG